MTRRWLAVAVMVCVSSSSAADVAKRALPDYDGRGDAPADAGEVALWVPRVALAPVYFASEYVVRRPVGWLVTTAERKRIITRLVELLTSADMKLGLIPTFYLERGYHPVAGVYGFADDVLVSGNQLRLSGSIGFGHRGVTLTDRYDRGGLRFAVRGEAEDRDDHAYHGIGPTTRAEDRQRFGLRRLQASAAVEGRAGVWRARAEVGARDVAFRGSDYDGDPPVTDAPGFAAGGYAGVYQRLELSLDTRVRDGGGFRVALDGEHGPSWNRVRGSASARAGLGRGRTVSIGATATLVEEADGEIPLSELATVGGSGPLPGFSDERLVGRSALAVAAQYEWPIWVFLNGALYAGAGNVFGERFEGLDPGLARLSAGMGLRTTGSTDHRFEMLVAFGTEPLRDGGTIESWRIVVGGTHAF